VVYETLLLIGVLGLLAQFALGFVGGGHGDHGHGDAHGGHSAHGADAHHAHAPGHAHHGDAHHDAHHGDGHAHGEVKGGNPAHGLSWLALLSPLTLFCVALGAGATGLLLKAVLPPLLLALAAALGGVGFYALAVRPLMRLVLGFASPPAKNLGGVVAREVEVLGRFDEAGRGMVKAEVDGQVVRLLAYLDPDMRKDGLTVIPGERLVVTEVDPRKNTVRVTRL
jgi:membrane protein implicated in regulation of membrane protease activity